MPITLLPDDTSGWIGLTLNITSTVMVLKEVLDNALDSGAQAVHVNVSPNTVDKIEVQDNRSGISPLDFDALGRYSHTGKLSSLGGLGKFGGKPLGFRGTALASINSLATVHVHLLELPSPRGNRQKASGNIEEHRQDEAASSSLRNTLHCPTKPNQSLKISPRLEKDIIETAVQIFGVQKASQCFVRMWPNGADSSIAFSGKEGGTRHLFEVTLMRPDAEDGKLPKGLFYSCLKKSSCPFTLGGVLKDIFICLSISCAPGWDDVNIEPAKEDVLFLQEGRLITGFENFSEQCKDDKNGIERLQTR
ncbi:hypothetical protein QBC36DRAFT_345255 [Triangularia setosa]|uniref:Uncharacterized protein n=1 Tax=Triangularia setosa TaxID=2587417 RepID=A0AAN6W9V5_9PEZI|nr:hypothetical protein QBC36DRAFT_345255 [Podospora setosa]